MQNSKCKIKEAFDLMGQKLLSSFKLKTASISNI